MDTNEVISALADGQLRDDELAHALETVCAERSALRTWHAYHLIGDVLRSRELAGGCAPQDFLAKLAPRLAQEPARPVPAMLPPLVPQAGRPAANDFRWKVVAGVASVAAFAAVGWTIVSPGTNGAGMGGQPQIAVLPPAQPQLASAPQEAAPATVLAGGAAGPMIRDPKLDELLAAHRQLGSASALQTPAGFLRNATFEGPSR
ncbi:sigma-E factor negative regulatory protein [Ramlibacter humi]|nr:sigma-E factor negative regulatory protein [Ramlibacter humi]